MHCFLERKANIDVMFMGLSNFWFTWSHARWSRKNIRANDSCLGQVLSGQCAPAGEYWQKRTLQGYSERFSQTGSARCTTGSSPPLGYPDQIPYSVRTSSSMNRSVILKCSCLSICLKKYSQIQEVCRKKLISIRDNVLPCGGYEWST